jgi:hypothetical protein
MLLPDELKTALQDAEKEAGVCRSWCRIGGSVDASGVYVTWHNSLGSSDSAEASIYNSTVLAMNQAALSSRLAKWIASLHARAPIDPNTGEVAR